MNIATGTPKQFYTFYMKMQNILRIQYDVYICSFDELLKNIRPFITKQTTTFRNQIISEQTS